MDCRSWQSPKMPESKVWGIVEHRGGAWRTEAWRESGLNPHYSKCGPGTRSSISIWGPGWNADFQIYWIWIYIYQVTHVHIKFEGELAYIWAWPEERAPDKKKLLNQFLRLGTSLGFCSPSSALNGSFWLPGFPSSCLVPLLRPALQPYNIAGRL